MDSLGDRMKHNYEDVTRFYLIRRMPVIIRLDGKAFHTFLRNTKKPFDEHFIQCMYFAAADVADQIQGFKVLYTQSDEVSILITDYDDLNTQGWFDYNIQKIVSVSAALMTAKFNFYYASKNAVFDSRVFNIPREEVANYFLWRALDWQRNSIYMYAGAFFSHKQLMNKGQEDIHEMLHGIGKNWATDLGSSLKNGVWGVKDSGILCNIRPSYDEIAKVVNPLIYSNEQQKETKV